MLEKIALQVFLELLNNECDVREASMQYTQPCSVVCMHATSTQTSCNHSLTIWKNGDARNSSTVV